MSLSFRDRRKREWATVAFGLLAAASVLVWSRTARQPVQANDTVVFSMSVSDQDGVLYTPVVMGEPGQKVQVRLMCEQNPEQEKMRLTLAPMGVEDGELLYSYDLSVKGHAESEHGTMKLAMGSGHPIRLRPVSAKGVTLVVYAEPLGKYLQRKHAHPKPRPLAS